MEISKSRITTGGIQHKAPVIRITLPCHDVIIIAVSTSSNDVLRQLTSSSATTDSQCLQITDGQELRLLYEGYPAATQQQQTTLTFTIGKSSAWWRHYVETLTASLALCKVVSAEFLSQLERPTKRSFDVSICFNQLLNKQFSSRGFGTPWCSFVVNVLVTALIFFREF